ncbi:MAG: hypothetical protein IJD70_03140 [Clostridia bacterium]|nr:hypothetical protein [Clostridia bacterium]
MKGKITKKHILLFVCMGLMFGLIFLTVFLTGGREIGEFTDTDRIIFTAFIIIEIVNIVVMMIVANMIGKANPPPEPIALPQSIYQKTLRRRGIIILVASIVSALGFRILGIVLYKFIPALNCTETLIIWCIAMLLPIVFFISSIVLQKLYVRKFANQSVAQIQSFMISHRERAEETAAEKLAYLKKLKSLCDIYAILFGILGAICSLFLGSVTSSSSGSGYLLYPTFLFLCAFSRIRFRTLEIFFDEDESCISEDSFPALFALAEKAARKQGCEEKIKIILAPDYGAGIAKESGMYCISLGVMLLNILSDDELYQILLHEFAHVTKENIDGMRERRYGSWLENGNQHFLSALTSKMYAFADCIYALQFSLYLYAASIQLETEADRAMALHGDSKIAASALTKLKYRDLYEWEIGTHDDESAFMTEAPDPTILKKDIDDFLSQIEKRKDFWDSLIDKEIISRQASHPTLKMRLETLGVSEYRVLPAEAAGSFADERIRALELMSELVRKANEENYEENRKYRYLEPLEKIKEWEEAGRPVISEEYADICLYLRALGRHIESDELCKKAIEELPSPANLHGYYMHGCFLLHTYDPSGLDYIYHAIENNTNYIEEGLQIIGEYCCIVGDQEELDTYREKALQIAQKDKDIYSKINVLDKGDDLTAEKLPEGMLEGIIDFIKSIDGDKVSKVYLVRKTITPDFFTSAVIVDFKEGAADDDQNEIMHKIFRYLDTSTDWQFSLFDYRSVAKIKVENIPNSLVYKA